MNEVLNEIYRTGMVQTAEGDPLNIFPASVSLEQGSALYDVVRNAGAKCTLEVGLAYGLSGLFMCQAVKDNAGQKHVSIDPGQNDHYRGIGLLNMQRANLSDLFEFHELTSERALPELIKRGERFDCIFIDGMHLYDFILVDFFLCDRLLKPGGRLILDDLWMPAVRKAIAFILRNRAYRIDRRSWGAPFKASRVIRRLARASQYVATHPFDLYSHRYIPASCRYNYVVLEKVSDDDRHHTHFAAF